MTTFSDDNGAITAYPLSWPRGWKRTTANNRRRANFSRRESNYNTSANGTSYRYTRQRDLTVNDAMIRVLGELRAFGVSRENIIISTNLDVRLDGLPRSGQRTPSDPGASVYWRRAGEDQRCMAIDQYDRVADNLAAIAATLGAMRAIERHGGAEILNRAFEGFAALPAPATVSWWTVLGITRNASLDEINSSFRALARRHHPDAGGDAEKFVIVKGAHDAALKERGAA